MRRCSRDAPDVLSWTGLPVARSTTRRPASGEASCTVPVRSAAVAGPAMLSASAGFSVGMNRAATSTSSGVSPARSPRWWVWLRWRGFSGGPWAATVTAALRPSPRSRAR